MCLEWKWNCWEMDCRGYCMCGVGNGGDDFYFNWKFFFNCFVDI